MKGDRYNTVPNMSAAIAIIWGLFGIYNGLFNNNHMFAINPSFYEPMTAFVRSQAFWGSVWLSAGITCLVLNFKGKVVWASWIISFAFLSFAVLYFNGDVTLPGWAMWGFVAICNFAYGRAVKWKV